MHPIKRLSPKPAFRVIVAIFSAAAALYASTASAAHRDVTPYLIESENYPFGAYGKLRVGMHDLSASEDPVEQDVFVFSGTTNNYAAQPGWVSNIDPGFTSPDELLFPPGTYPVPALGGKLYLESVVDSALGAPIAYWNGAGPVRFSALRTGEQIELSVGNGVASGQLTISAGDTTTTRLLLSDLDAQSFHLHTSNRLWGTVSHDSAVQPTAGFYIYALRFRLEQGGQEITSETFYVIMGNGYDKYRYEIEERFGEEVEVEKLAPEMEAAIAWANQQLAPRNRPPIAKPDFFTIAGQAAVNPLLNDADADYDALQVVELGTPAHGSATWRGSQVIYTPGPDFAGYDTFSYTVSDGKGHSASSTVEVSNPYLPLAGTYRPVLTSRGATVGNAIISVTNRGLLTGTVALGRERYAFRGVVGADGKLRQAFPSQSALGGNLKMTLLFGQDNVGYMGVRMTLSSPAVLYSSAQTAADASALPEGASAGRYNCTLPGSDAGPGFPNGTGWFTAALNRRAILTAAGRLPNGQVFTFATRIRKDGTTNLAAPFSGVASGYFKGRLSFAATFPNDVTGSFELAQAPSARGLFRSGFTYGAVISGERYLPPARGDSVFSGAPTSAPAVVTTFTGATVSGSPVAIAGRLVPAGFFVPDSATSSRVAMRLNPANGLFAGSAVLRPGGRFAFDGVILRNRNQGAGLLRGGTQTGVVEITAPQ